MTALKRGPTTADNDGQAYAREAIRVLESARRYDPRKNPTPSEKLVRRWERRAVKGVAVSVGFVALLALVAHIAGWPDAGLPRQAGFALLYVGIAFSVAFLLVDPLVWASRLRRTMDEPAHHGLGSFAHEQRTIARLAALPASALAAVDHWLATRVAGIEGRVGVMYGEKVSAMALVTVLITAGRSLLDLRSIGTVPYQGWMWAFGAGFAGVLLCVGVLLRLVSASYAYQRQLLAEAIRLSSEQEEQGGAAVADAS